jgi:hypothetical protein
MKGRMDGHCMRRAVRVRVPTGGGDVMRRRLREERSDGRKGISGGGGMVEVVGAAPRAARGARVRGAHRDGVA